MRPAGLEGANWTEERKDLLRAMALTHPAIEIAKALGPGFSKNMVIGKCRRMNVGLEWWPDRNHAEKSAVWNWRRGRPPAEPSMKPKRVRKPKAVQEKPWKPGGILLRCGWVGW